MSLIKLSIKIEMIVFEIHFTKKSDLAGGNDGMFIQFQFGVYFKWYRPSKVVLWHNTYVLEANAKNMSGPF